MKNNFSFFQNTECEYFPCHKLSDADFNCLFCYCPLYALGDKCGGNFTYIEGGIKDCSNCTLPHTSSGYSYIAAKIDGILDIAKKVK